MENSPTTLFRQDYRRDKISLTEDQKTISEDLQIADLFNSYFNNAIYSLCDQNVPTEPSTVCSQNSTPTATRTYFNHLLHSVSIRNALFKN